MTAILERVASQRRRRTARIPFNLAETFDRAAILAKLDALHAEAGIEGVAHFAVVGLFRDAVTAARAKVRHALEDGGDGLRCARDLSTVQDELIRTLFDYIAAHVHPASDHDRSRLVVAAVGGYGRGTWRPVPISTFCFWCRPRTTPGRCVSWRRCSTRFGICGRRSVIRQDR